MGSGPITQLGPFKLGAVIGSGGFGTVYRATDPNGRDVAVKVLAPHADSEETLRRFKREGDIRIDHPNVVQVLDAGQEDGLFYIAFELLVGKPLIALLEKAPLSPEAVVDLGVQICAGLSAAHRRGVVHRDLKPGNVFVCEDGTLKVLDFGIARPMSQAGPGLTMAGSVIGTPGFLSPEQAKGDPVITPAADLWSLGVILYQAASGTNPFMRTTAVATILAVVLEEAPPIGKTHALPRGLAEVIHRCLHKEPSERWPSAEALSIALQGVDVEGSVTASIPPELAPSIAIDEQRVVALLLAADVHDLSALEKAVKEWGGELTPMLGGALGVFGGRTYEGDESVRAVQAAIAARGSASWIGVAAGRATGVRGGVSGDAVRAVERAVDAKLDGVAIDGALVRSLGGIFDVRPATNGVFEIPRTMRRLDSGSFPAFRDDLPLFDREAEIAQLENAIETAFGERRATVVWVSGPPGIGKSRLRAELERALRKRDGTILTGRAESHRRDAAFHLLGSALRSEPTLEPFFLNAAVPVDRRRRALEDFLAITLEDSTWARQCLEPISRVLGLPEPELPHVTHSKRSDPQLMADRVRVSLADVLGALSSRAPLAIVLDDVQWADDASLTLLDELVGRLLRRPFLVFIAARGELGERMPELFATREVVRIVPRGLHEEHVAKVAESIARVPVPAELVQRVALRTGGNPFFVEQIVRELAEQKLLESAIDTLPIPLDVEGAVQSRIDHLPADEKQVVKKAAIYSGAFTESALRALEVEDADRHLSALARRGLIAPHVSRTAGLAGTGTEREYRFKNELVAEVAYRMSSEEARRELHCLAAGYLANLGSADREELGRHLELGDQTVEAALAYADAASRAARRGDSASVLRCADRALALGLGGVDAFDLHLVRAEALSFLGRRDEQEQAIESAIALADTPLLLARSLSEKAGFLISRGRHEEALVAAVEAVSSSRAGGDADVHATALVRRGWVLLHLGRVPEAAESIGEAVGLMPQLTPETAALVAVWRAQLATAMGDLGKRKDAYEEAIARFRAVGDLRRVATAECNLADTLNRVGAYEQAEQALREAVSACRRVGNRVVEGYALANLGYALAGQERIDEALVELDAALALAHELGLARLAVAIRLYRMRALLSSGRAADADEGRAIAASAKENGIPALEATALAVASRAALAAGKKEEALADAEAALAIRDEIGTMEEDEAEVFLALAEALEANGQDERCKEIIARGASRLEFLAGRIADVDWRARFLVEVPVNRRLIELDGRAAG